jgi:hypothetical protein
MIMNWLQVPNTNPDSKNETWLNLDQVTAITVHLVSPHSGIWEARAHTGEGHGGDRFYVLIEGRNSARIKERLAEMLENEVHPIPANLTGS